MPSRLLQLRFVCSFAILLAALAAAQSHLVTQANPPNAVADSRKLPAGVAATPAGTGQTFKTARSGASDRFRADRLAAAQADSNAFIFLPVVDYPSGGSYASSVAIDDLNGDGHPDVVVVNPRGGGANDFGIVGVLLGHGDGTFGPPVSYSSAGYQAAFLAIRDVNGDGKLDLVMANQCQDAFNCAAGGGVGVLLGNGDGTFQAPVSYSSGGYLTQSLVVGDVNGDGKLDLVVANQCQTSSNCSNGGTVSVLLGNGDGTFQTPVSYSSGGFEATYLAIGDFNQDGKLDLAVANNCATGPNCTTGGIVNVLLGNGDGTFEVPVDVYNTVNYSAYSIAIGDVNGDGKPDLFVGLYDPGGVTVLLGNGDGTFQSGSGYSSGGTYVYSIAIGDVNGDGKQDLVVANADSSSVGILLGNGDGTFQSAASYASGGGSNSVAIGDLNGDGKPDLVVANGGVGVLLNNNGAPPTTTSLVSSANPANLKQPVTYTATVTSQSAGTLSGTVVFHDWTNTIATVPLVNNQAAYSTSYNRPNKAGTHYITATYWGEFNVAAESQSAILTEYARLFHSKVVVTTSGSPSLIGQAVTFTATATSKAGKIPDGELVTFFDGSKALASVALAGGKAAYTTSTLSATTHFIKATYVGDNIFEPSTDQVIQVVELYPTTTVLSSSPNPSTYGQAVKLTATVSSGAPGGPTGTVTFKNGTTTLGTAHLSAGTATLTTKKLPAGTLTITARYNGDAHSASSSATVTQVVQ